MIGGEYKICKLEEDVNIVKEFDTCVRKWPTTSPLASTKTMVNGIYFVHASSTWHQTCHT
jgi:hypothetical protein